MTALSGSEALPVAPSDDLVALRDALRRFADERAWGRFHTPKNLAMALAGEVGEVLAHFQWLDGEESAALDQAARREVALELADVLLYLVRLADVLDVDLGEAARDKLAINAVRYPVDKAHGRATKYDKL
ncbi:MAG: nucleotide pyrophosphohydrolase [Rhodocyclaceae bacterium]